MKPHKQEMRSASLLVRFAEEEVGVGRAMCRRDSAPTLPRAGHREEEISSVMDIEIQAGQRGILGRGPSSILCAPP
jgi:hypothetical protein